MIRESFPIPQSRLKQMVDYTFDLACEHVENSSHAKVACTVWSHNTSIMESSGFNTHKSHPRAAKALGSVGEHDLKIYRHAEMNALLAVDGILMRYGPTPLTLVVARAKRPHAHSLDWVWGDAKPCDGCRAFMKLPFGPRKRYTYPIEHIVWTNDGGTIGIETLDNGG